MIKEGGKTLVQKIEGDKKTEIDITLVKKIGEEYQNCLLRRKNSKDREHIKYSNYIMEEAEKLDKEQMKYLVNYLTNIANHLSDLYQKAYDDPEKFCERVKTYKGLMEIIHNYPLIKEGKSKKGGINPPPKNPKPKFRN